MQDDSKHRTRQQEIDGQWFAVKPASQSRGKYSGERKMLYDLLDSGEQLQRMVGGTFRQDTDRLHPHKGVAIATSKRVLFLDKGLFGSEEIMEIAYRNIESVTYSSGMFRAGVQVKGKGASSYRIEDISDKKSVIPFVACIRDHIAESGTSQPASNSHPSVAEELARLGDLLDRGLIDKSEFDQLKQDLLNRP